MTPFITGTRDGAHPVEGVQTFPSFMFKDLQRSVFYLLKEHTQRKCFNLWGFYTIKMKLEIEKQQKHIKHKLVGGWTNPSDKYARQIEVFPQIGINIKHISNHHPT